jgi:enoyl-CoA hydratase/carnithine racemase
MSELDYTKDGSVAVLTLNRPERMNTITPTMLAALSQSLLEANQDNEVRVVVVTGAGRAFCAGLDLVDATSGSNIGGDPSKMPATINLRDTPPVVLHGIDKPTLCALNGGAAGYGFDLAMGCDIRIAATNAKLSAAFTKRGLVPESGGTWLLPRMLGWAKAAELIFTGRTLTAEQAFELGLVNRVVEQGQALDATMELAHEIAGNAPLAVQASKRMMRSSMSEEFDDHVHHVYLQLLPLMNSQDFQEGMRSFLEKRDPVFEGR